MKRMSLIIITLLSVVSCRKDDFDVTKITIGDYSKVKVDLIDSTISGSYNTSIEYQIDIDKDGINDFMFTHTYWGSQGAGIHAQSSISCLHKNAELHGDLKNYTYFLNIDTSTYFNYYDNITHGTIAHNHTCHRLTPLDELINQTSVNTIKPLLVYDVLEQNDSYFNAKIILADEPIGYSIHTSTVGDTAYHIYDSYYNDCNEFPVEKMTYIGVKLNQISLGWIKIGIYNDGIKILETAFIK